MSIFVLQEITKLENRNYCHQAFSHRKNISPQPVAVLAIWNRILTCTILNWIFYGHYRSIFNHWDIIGLKICRIPCKNAKWGLLQRSRSFKVIEVGTNRKPIYDFLLVINSNWHPISYRFGVIAAYCSNFAPTRPL